MRIEQIAVAELTTAAERPDHDDRPADVREWFNSMVFADAAG